MPTPFVEDEPMSNDTIRAIREQTRSFLIRVRPSAFLSS